MPQFDLRGIKVAKYVNTAGTITYTDAQTVGDAMNVNLELRFAEGRLYAESTLAEFMRKVVGGTISIGVKYIPTSAQKLMYGCTDKNRNVTVSTGSTVTVSGLLIGGADVPKYVGVAFYAPDMVDGVEKFCCVKVAKALFGQPSLALQTAGENITFATPTTSGEFLADDSTSKALLEVATCDTEAAAKAWVTTVLA